MDIDHDTGYAVYDTYDLGEFDQKGSVRTKYGTKDEYLAAIAAVKDAGMHAYADVVQNHRMGADETVDGMSDTEEALRAAAEDETEADDLEDTPVFDRADVIPKII